MVFRCWLRFVPCTASAAGEQSTAIQGSWRLCIAAYLHFLQTAPPRSFLQCLSNNFSSLDQCCYCCCGCSLAIVSQADQNGVVLKMSEFLALLAIESHRTAAQHIEVAGSKGNTSQTFANIVAVDLAWKKNGKQVNNLFYPDKKKVWVEWSGDVIHRLPFGLTAVIIQKCVLVLFHFARARNVVQRKPELCE